MDTVAQTLANFLLARIDEDEAVAQGAARTSTSDWIPAQFGVGGFDARVDDHIARHDPARVLAECEAKRQIVKWAKSWPLRPSRPSDEDAILRPLALPYADHPDYRDDWRPESQ